VIEFLPVPRHAQIKMKPNDFSDARILVAGSLCFIGSALVWMLNRLNNESF
jgi:hypothetical protein